MKAGSMERRRRQKIQVEGSVINPPLAEVLDLRALRNLLIQRVPSEGVSFGLCHHFASVRAGWSKPNC